MKINKDLHKILITENLRNRLIKKFHNNFGHIRVKKMPTLISSTYYWPEVTKSIKEFVECCSVCQTNKIQGSKRLGELSQFGPAKEPFGIISIDTVGGLSCYN